MIRYTSLEEISDGKLYTREDMVKANCLGCEGCSACCHGMGNTVVLDPYDFYRMTSLRGVDASVLFSESVELGVVDGLILPSLKMVGKDEACGYLNEDGRCRIHEYRPGICRLFPLGRYYDGGNLYYFLQKDECPLPTKAKIKVKQWIDTKDLKTNELFEIQWHNFLKDEQEKIIKLEEQGQEDIRQIECKKILKFFYLNPYQKEVDFYTQYYARLENFANV